MHRPTLSCCLLLLLCLAGLSASISPAAAQNNGREWRTQAREHRLEARQGGMNRPEREQNSRQENLVLPDDVAEQTRLSVVLGQVTASSVTASIVSQRAGDAYIDYGSQAGQPSRKTALVSLRPNEPAHLLLDGLAPNARSHYRLYFRPTGQDAFGLAVSQSIQTQRAPGSAFVFEIQGDSHPERRHQFDPALYAQTLRAAAADRPDFYILMGDDFSVDTLPAHTASSVAGRYWLQRPFLSLIGQSTPLFLVNGNHEQAARSNLDGSANNVAVWAQNARHALFPQPGPDRFYSGDPEQVPHIGLLRDYYAWHWGDALFIVIDPYWHTTQNVFGGRGDKQRDLWDVTLGESQYRWLKQTLENSRARHKFVFTHHILGTGRGGTELAGMYEWGGRNRRGIDEFKSRRPGWEMPIHSLLVKHKVSIVFQGHDHLFARQMLDGVTYQTLPQPADPNYASGFSDAYLSGDRLPNSGRLRVSVTPQKLTVEYLPSYLPTAPEDNAAKNSKNTTPIYSYTLVYTQK